MNADNYTSERLADRAKITDVIHGVARGFDRKDWDMVAQCYHPGAIDNHGLYNGPIEGFIAFCARRHETVVMSMHNISNVMIEFADHDHALAESYCFNWQRMAPEHDETGWEERKKEAGVTDMAGHHGYFDRYGANRYVDMFTRVDGRWRIHERTVVSEGFVMMNPPPAVVGMALPMIAGRRDQDDPLYLLRDRLFAMASRPQAKG